METCKDFREVFNLPLSDNCAVYSRAVTNDRFLTRSSPEAVIGAAAAKGKFVRIPFVRRWSAAAPAAKVSSSYCACGMDRPLCS